MHDPIEYAIVDIDVEVALPEGGFLNEGLEITLNSDNQNCLPVPLPNPIIIPQNSDVRGVATSSQSDTIVTISMAGPLALDITD